MLPRALLVFCFTFSCRSRSPPALHTSNAHLQATTTLLWLRASCLPIHWHSSSYLQPPTTSTASLWLVVQRLSRGLLAFSFTPPSRTEPLICARFTTRSALLPSPSSDHFSERHALACPSFFAHSLGECGLTSQGHDCANRRPLYGETNSFLYFSCRGRYFSALAPSMMFRQSNV